jgi:hypothetical protein
VKDPVVCFTNNSSYAFAAVGAVRGWNYRPATLGDKPVEYRLLVVMKSDVKRQWANENDALTPLRTPAMR